LKDFLNVAKILALVGPTASGKSDIALELAQKYQAEILSCDSLLVYRDLNIGTAKPTKEERGDIPHHGIDLVNLDQQYTAADYVRYVRPIIDRLVKENKPILIVGGTGFYLKALLCGTWDAPPTQPELRITLEKEDPNELHARLTQLDPEYAPKVAANDKYRVVRALEIIQVTGETMTALLAKRELQNPLPYPYTVIGIRRPKPELERRIAARANAMFSHGLVNETKQLLERYKDAPRPMFCVGYNEVMQFLKGEMSLPECRERIAISTRQLAKKQMTFFRGMPVEIQWFDLPKQESELRVVADKALGTP